MAKFVVIGERIHCISPTIRQAMETMTPDPILKRAKEQLDALSTCDPGAIANDGLKK